MVGNMVGSSVITGISVGKGVGSAVCASEGAEVMSEALLSVGITTSSGSLWKGRQEGMSSIMKTAASIIAM